MRLPTRGWLLVAAMLTCATPARAQLGEVQLGGGLSYGTGAVYGRGAGLVLGVSAGRLAYVGLRWTAHQGATSIVLPPGGAREVRTRTQVGALDLGVVIPAGVFEVVPGFSLGVVWFQQRDRPAVAGGTATYAHAEEFLVAPGVSVEAHLAGVVLIPQVQYYLSGQPDLPWAARNGGMLTSVRLVLPIEVRRIRH